MFVTTIQKSTRSVANACASLLKVALLSRRPSAKGATRPLRDLIILGNGPSLNDTLREHAGALERADLFAVNFAANTPQFLTLKPDLYILADPHFFVAPGTNADVDRLWSNISRADWPMTLYVPCGQKRKAQGRLGADTRVELKVFNLTPAEGPRWLTHALFNLGLAMPRPRNVLIPAIMTGLREGYRNIFLTGADHSWSQTLSVDDSNRVVSVQPHFYADSDKELKRVSTEYEGYHLHDILGSLTIAFRSYFDIRDYAEQLGATITNATPESMIDAFPRGTLS